jgi:hypothetical protein
VFLVCDLSIPGNESGYIIFRVELSTLGSTHYLRKNVRIKSAGFAYTKIISNKNQ